MYKSLAEAQRSAGLARLERCTHLIGFRNRSIVAMNWVWNYLTLRRGMRLITGVTGSHVEDMRRCVLSPTAAKTDGAALPYAATATLEQSSRQAPQSVHVDSRMDQAGTRQNDKLRDSNVAVHDLGDLHAGNVSDVEREKHPAPTSGEHGSRRVKD